MFYKHSSENETNSLTAYQLLIQSHYKLQFAKFICKEPHLMHQKFKPYPFSKKKKKSIPLM